MTFLLIILGIVALLSAIALLFLRFANRDWWKIKTVRRAALAVPIVTLIGIGLLLFGFASNQMLITAIGSIVASLAFVVLLAMVLAFPLSGIFHIIAGVVERHSKSQPMQKTRDNEISRRSFLRKAAVAFPAATLTAGVGGFSASFLGVKIPEIDFKYDDLPDQLNGFRILHFSDLHLGRYFRLSDLETLIDDARIHRPDLILITGDICDVTADLPETLDLMASLNPAYGCLASLGNHEYYHGVRKCFRIHAQSDVPLLVNRGTVIDVNGADLFVGGVDDPRDLWGNADDFLRETVDYTLAAAPETSFKVLMSHRPRGFTRAAERGVHLTLAGHTHGGQVGLAGRSIFESEDPPNFYWGKYTKGKSRLYTSAGVGHWFPFRLGCPAEAPVITLRKSM
jgi:predicted MPP superfamily phosphohydrolase